MSWQLLEALAGRGHTITAIAPITETDRKARETARTGSGLIRERRFVMPYLQTSPDFPASSEYRDRERELVAQMLAAALSELSPDVLIVGRESFAPYATDITETLRVLVVHGSTTEGIVNGSYPSRLADPLLAAINSYDLVVTPAAHTRETMARLGVPDVRVVRNPVDVGRFRPAPPYDEVRRSLDIRNGDVVVTHASNLKKLKRALDVVDAAEIALAQDRRLLFVVAGDGPDADAVRSECKARGLAGRFRFTGWLEHDRMPELFCSSDIVLMPSQAECQALVYLEAQACGCVLIASDIAGAREIVEHGVTGWLYPVGQPPALAEAVLTCAADGELRRTIGAQAASAVGRHALADVADDYENLLQALVAGRALGTREPSSL